MDKYTIRVKAKIDVYTDVVIDAPSLSLAKEEALIEAQSLPLEAWEVVEDIDELRDHEFDLDVLDEEDADSGEYDDADGIPYSHPLSSALPSRTPIDSPRMRLVGSDYESPGLTSMEPGSTECQID